MKDFEKHLHQELEMASSDLLAAAKAAAGIKDRISSAGDIEPWQASKINTAADYLTTVFQSLDSDTLHQDDFDPEQFGLMEKEVWDKPKKSKKKPKKLSSAKKSAARARAKRAGRPYPNLIDNMWASTKESVDRQGVEEGILHRSAGWMGQKLSGWAGEKRLKPGEYIVPFGNRSIAFTVMKSGQILIHNDQDHLHQYFSSAKKIEDYIKSQITAGTTEPMPSSLQNQYTKSQIRQPQVPAQDLSTLEYPNASRLNLKEQGVAEGGAETSWSHGNEKITLQDILELTKHIKQINLPINDNLKNKLIHWDGNPEEIERINQVTVSNQFPILVMLDNQGQIDWILDGNHRLHKAIQSQAKTIPAKLIKPSDLDDKAKRIFHINEQGVAEGVNDYLWHGSREEHDVLYPRQANDTGGKEESNKNAVYATPNAKVAIAMGLTTPGSDTGMFPNDPQMVLFKGNIRKGQMVYLHKVPKDLFIKHNSREWYSKPGVEEVKPIEVVKVPVDKYLNLIRQATPQDLELRKKYMKQGAAEGLLAEASSDEAWELVGQPVPEIQQFVKQMGYGNDEQSVAKITAIIDKAASTQIPAASIPKLKNLANKGSDIQTLKAVQQISGRPDAEQQYTKLMQARDAGEGRRRDVSGYLQYVKSGNYDPPVLLKLPTGIYVIGGRTRLYAALALGVPANVKIISANSFKQGVAEDSMSLHDWFGKGKHGGAGGGGWDRYNTKGERIGKCGERSSDEGKPKCLSKSKAASLRASGGKKAIAAAVNKKRRNDSNPDRRGKAINVSSKKAK